MFLYLLFIRKTICRTLNLSAAAWNRKKWSGCRSEYQNNELEDAKMLRGAEGSPLFLGSVSSLKQSSETDLSCWIFCCGSTSRIFNVFFSFSRANPTEITVYGGKFPITWSNVLSWFWAMTSEGLRVRSSTILLHYWPWLLTFDFLLTDNSFVSLNTLNLSKDTDREPRNEW